MEIAQMAKKVIALSLDEEVISELRRISGDSDAPVSRVANRRLRESLKLGTAAR
jgi:hypothetical protein